MLSLDRNSPVDCSCPATGRATGPTRPARAAICEAMQRPKMRFVPVKTEEQQAQLMVHRGREGLVIERTACINRIRGLLSATPQPRDRNGTPLSGSYLGPQLSTVIGRDHCNKAVCSVAVSSLFSRFSARRQLKKINIEKRKPI